MRIITSGSGVTTNAVLPTGRFINLVVTIGRDGAINVYVDGARIGGGSYSNFAIDGCAPAEIRIGADQGGGQRISAELDRTAMFTKALSERTVRAGRRSRSSTRYRGAPVGGTVPKVLALTFGQSSANLGTFAPGVTADYTATLGGDRHHERAHAALSVHDPARRAPATWSTAAR